MPTARSLLVDLNTTPYYHCYVRCVRRAFLFQYNEQGHLSVDRKPLIVNRLKRLAQVFSIQICAYAIMDNHYHVVVHVDAPKAQAWSEAEVLERLRLLSPHQANHATPALLTLWRQRLADLSWFMRYLNEYVARVANQEDDVTGHFWEGRFKSQALTDEGALLACMAYVDLNPIRAKKSDTLESSDFTSIQERLAETSKATHETLMTCQSKIQNETDSDSKLPFTAEEYLELVQWTALNIHKKSPDTPHFVCMKKACLNPEQWLTTLKHYQSPRQNIVGSLQHLRQWAQKIKQRWVKGAKLAQQLYLAPA